MIIALMFLALISIPIARVVTRVGYSEEPNSANIVNVIQKIDPSIVPKSDAVQIMPVGVASTYNIYPSTTNLNVYYTLRDTWYDNPLIAVLAPQATGQYAFYVWVFLTNPSYKWACACLPPDVSPTPYSIVSSFGYAQGMYSTWYLYPTAANLTWSGQNLFVWRLEVVATVTSTSGVFNINMPFNQMRTDITGPNGVPDGIVDMRDIGLVAVHYGTRYNPDQSTVYAWNIVLDHSVDYTDISAVVFGSGRTIPP